MPDPQDVNININADDAITSLATKLGQAHRDLAMNEAAVQSLGRELAQARQTIERLSARLGEVDPDDDPTKE